MKKILVTGGAGFIGSNFVRYMLSQHPDYEIVNLDALTYAGNLDNLTDIESSPKYRFVHGDICDRPLVEELAAGCHAIVHFAAETHVDRSILDAGAFVTTDVLGTHSLLEAARKHQVNRFVQISTDEVYGEAVGRPSKETDALMPKSPYAASKAGADRLAFSYFTTYDLPVVITRCSNNFGAYQYPEKLIPLFVTNVLEDTPVPVYGDGKNTRDWIYVADHCEALDVVLHAEGVEGEVFNVGAGMEKSILEITGVILKTLGKPAELVSFVTDRLGHVKRHAVDTSKIKEALGWEAKTDFETALVETVKWYENNPAWWKKLKQKMVAQES